MMKYWWKEEDRKGAGIYLWLALIAILLVTLARPAFGQIDRIQEEFEKTQRVIERAAEAVRAAGSLQGKALLEQAVKLQRTGVDFARNRQFQRALRLTQLAREKAFAAIGATRTHEDNELEVRRQLERTGQLLQEIRSAFREVDVGGIPLVARQLEVAANQQKRALEFFHQNRLRPALKLTLSAREKAFEIREHALQAHRQFDDLARALETTENALDQARLELEDRHSDQGEAMLRRAVEAFAQAREALAARRPRPAEEALKRARHLLSRVYVQIAGDVEPGEVESLLESARDRWNDLRDAIEGAVEPKIVRRMEAADDHLRRAEDNIGRSRPERALAQIRRAMTIMDRVEEELSD